MSFERLTEKEIASAKELRRDGLSWGGIARLLGKRHGDGIRRRFDPAYRKKRNAYQMKYMRGFRAKQQLAE